MTRRLLFSWSKTYFAKSLLCKSFSGALFAEEFDFNCHKYYNALTECRERLK